MTAALVVVGAIAAYGVCAVVCWFAWDEDAK